ncbi:hypothetical protein ACFY93_28070 [Streptomyces sp. NPDC008313]|uniref:hypothetical protein n=1 Tax=Streptomyces sp. NPDC008313 TaxID=3364826 RepID=UPI0036F17658
MRESNRAELNPPSGAGCSPVPFPRSRWLTPDRGSRPRNAFNQLFALAAVFGILAATWGLWLENEERLDRKASRQRITGACAGLADPGKVLGLNGGTTRVRPGSRSGDRFASHALPGTCVLYRVGEPGTTYGHFELSVHTDPSGRYAHVLSGTEDPFEERAREHTGDLTRVADESPEYPLDAPGEDDGRVGHYGDDSADVKVVCEKGEAARGGTGQVTSVNAVARADYEHVGLADRLALVELARDAAYKAAKRIGCTPETPAPLVARLYIADARLVKATSPKAGGTCGWYRRFVELEGLGKLPDRALSAPVGEHSVTESCLLAASPAQTRRVWPTLAREKTDSVRLDDVLDHQPWWIRTDSFFGDEAREVVAERIGGHRTPARPGTAGVDRAAGVWWASSTCEGRPAVHTFTIGLGYDDAARPRARAAFKAYVDSVTESRGCTGVTFPKASAFRP